jgi:hypothetical protein
MRHESRTIHLTAIDSGKVMDITYLALKEDGSIWLYKPFSQDQQWTLCTAAPQSMAQMGWNAFFNEEPTAFAVRELIGAIKFLLGDPMGRVTQGGRQRAEAAISNFKERDV